MRRARLGTWDPRSSCMFVRRQARWWRAKICVAPLEEFQQGPPLMETKRSAATGPEWGGFVRGDESSGRTNNRGAWYPYIEQVHLQASPRTVIPHRWMSPASGAWSLPPANGYKRPGLAARSLTIWKAVDWQPIRSSHSLPNNLAFSIAHYEVFPVVGVRRRCRCRRSEARRPSDEYVHWVLSRPHGGYPYPQGY